MEYYTGEPAYASQYCNMANKKIYFIKKKKPTHKTPTVASMNIISFLNLASQEPYTIFNEFKKHHRKIISSVYVRLHKHTDLKVYNTLTEGSALTF